jgi:hypothetical protein
VKYPVFGFLWSLCLSASIVSADPVNGVNILSQSYSVSGSYAYAWYQSTSGTGQQGGGALYSEGTGTFGASSSDGSLLQAGYLTPTPPIALSITSGLYVNYSINTFSFQFNGFALPGEHPFVSSDGSTAYWMTLPPQTVITSSAQADWLFQPTADNQQITLNFVQSGSSLIDQTLSMTLSDITGMNTLLAYSGHYYGDPNAPQTLSFSLNSGDQYQLSITSQCNIFDFDGLNQQFSASIEPTLEPSVFFLFPLAFVSLIASRKLFSFNRRETK